MWRNFITEDQGAWYEIGLTPRGICLRVHDEAFGALVQYAQATAPIVEQQRALFKLGEFVGVADGQSWGFDGVMRPLPLQRDHWRAWEVAWVDDTRQVVNDREKFLHAACNTLLVAFMILNGYGQATNSDLRQLICPSTILLVRDCYGAAMNAVISPTMHRFFAAHVQSAAAASNCEVLFDQVEELMCRAWFELETPVEEDAEENEFVIKESAADRARYIRHAMRASVRRAGWLTLDVPGNACGLQPEDFEESLDVGYELSCHNMDIPIQQFVCLVGLAALHDLARAEGY